MYYFLFLFLSVLAATNVTAISGKTYDYIVVGSGPGGGPLAANLARAGNSVLLLEAGDDQGDNVNTTLTSNANAATNDPKTRWDFFVEHSPDPEIQSKYLHTVWRKTDGSFYVGLDPPEGAERLGVWYPRAATLGGCAMHNAAAVFLPNDEYWDDIAALTGDASWKARNMRKHFMELEHCLYFPEGTPGHGFHGYLNTSQADPSWVNNATDGRVIAELAAEATGADPADIIELLGRDINSNDPNRDTSTGIFGAVSHANQQGIRSSPNNYIRATLADAADYPLTVQLNTLVTRVLFDKHRKNPVATGVEFLEGQSLYKADPRHDPKAKGKIGKVYASKEVIISGGVFNSPQILKLSGIGPAHELRKFGIPVVKDLPGVGQRMADNYEGGIIGLASRDFKGFPGYFTNVFKSSVSKSFRDLYIFCGQLSFEGFWPGFPTDYGASEFECSLSHMYPHSQEGTVLLRSADPRDPPVINMHFFDKEADTDLTAMLDGIKWARGVLAKVPDGLGPFEELHPCKGKLSSPSACTDEEQREYLRNQVYSHHATSTCAIGADNDRMAVLDSKFRVRGVEKLRVVDGSAFPRAPGAFPVISTFMLGQKPADLIINGGS